MYLVGCKWWTFGSKTCDLKLLNFICSGYVCVCLSSWASRVQWFKSPWLFLHLAALLSKPTVPVIKMILFYFQAECEWVKAVFCQALFHQHWKQIQVAIRIQFRFHKSVHERNLQAPISIANLASKSNEVRRLPPSTGCHCYQCGHLAADGGWIMMDLPLIL